MSLSGFFSIVSGGFVAAPPLINNCSALWNSEKVMETEVLPIRNGAKRAPRPGAPQALLGIINRMGLTPKIWFGF